MDNTATLNIGRLSVEIPADCPDRSVFENVVRDELQSTFGGDAGRAAFAKSEFDRCMDVPEPFVQNTDATDYYQLAQMAMPPAGQQWQMFKDKLQAHFLDRHPDDGTAQEPAIPGWQPPREIRIAVRPIAKVQKVERGAGQERER
jgi:hypothetical protein